MIRLGAPMIYFDNRTIGQNSDLPPLLDALREAFLRADHQPKRSHYDLPAKDEVLLVMPSWFDDQQLGIKLITVAPDREDSGRGSVRGVYIMLDAVSGRAVALLDAAALTAYRTAGVCALAASLLAPPESKTMLMIGTGALAAPLIRAHASVRRLRKVVIWGRSFAKAERVASDLGALGPCIEIADNLDAAVADADIICSATHSRDPLVHGTSVREGSYIALIGSFAPHMREGDDALFRRGRLVVDTFDAFSESGDLIGPAEAGLLPPAMDLGALLRGHEPSRSAKRDVTIFKSVGVGLADLAAANVLLTQAGSKDAKILPIEIG